MVYFATNRKVLDDEGLGVERFGKEISDLSYGSCLVNIPIETHTAGSWKCRVGGKTRSGKALLGRVSGLLEKSQFLAATDPSDLLLFVHGFNTKFEFCVLRWRKLFMT